MILTVHALAGAASGSFGSQSYPIAALLGFLSHLVLDVFPHAEYKIENLKKGNIDKKFFGDLSRVFLDALIGLSLVAYLSWGKEDFLYIMTGVVFGIFPDFMSFLGFIFKNEFFKKFMNFHEKIHVFKYKNVWPPLRVLSQVFIFILAIIILASIK